ncbi:hypothetical protein DAI22_12g171550 [Oryza sativa Japonica Group]|nr:hypothetical protein DAI22_12g171550 [Oryza sativa Japonica Group]
MKPLISFLCSWFPTHCEFHIDDMYEGIGIFLQLPLANCCASIWTYGCSYAVFSRSFCLHA